MKKKLWIYVQPDNYEDGGIRYTYWDCDMSSIKHEANFCGNVEIEFNDPGKEKMIKGFVKSLRAEQRKIRAEAEKEANKIEEQIHQLLAIEDKS